VSSERLALHSESVENSRAEHLQNASRWNLFCSPRNKSISQFWTVKNLPHPDNKHLEAAEGWLGLGNWREANEDLEKIAPEHRTHPFVLELRYKIYEAAGNWAMALDAAKGLREILPDDQWGHFYTAYALHELKRTQEAYDVLKAVVEKFPNHQFMRFNLACYSCRLGEFEEAMQWLKKAIRVQGETDIRQLALDDRDLEPLWKEISKI